MEAKTTAEQKHPIFYFNITNKVTDVALRLSISKFLPDELGIRIDNKSEHEVKVYLQGDKTAIERFYGFLKKQKLGKAENYEFSELKPLETAGCMQIDTSRFFHKLECEQMEKFVYVGEELRDEMRGMHGEMKGMRDEIKDLPKRIAEELGKVLRP